MAMGGFKHFIFRFLGGLALILLVHAQDQSGFISIDCGLPANSSYSEETTTGINYISDATFIHTGVSQSISPELKGTKQHQVWNLRSFPQGIRNCYSINITGGIKYLIRATFLYGNYDGKSNFPEFDLYLGANMWDTIKLENASISVIKELIHIPSSSYMHICLANTGRGTPFISAIEFRPLKNTSYVTTSGSLALISRADVGSISNRSYRYPYDVYDRLWLPYNFYQWKDLSTSLTIDSQSHNYYQPPSVVMSTASTPINDSAPMQLYWEGDDPTTQYYIYMHFAEVVKLQPNQSRSFNITINGKPWYGPLVPDYLYTTSVFSTSAMSGGKYVISLFKTESSTLPPIINAFELYSVKDLSQSETAQDDVDAIRKIKSAYGIARDWQGDPCAPKAYTWEGLNCSYNGANPPRITSLDLSSSGLTGEISADISHLLMLQYLDLSNNSLSGLVPDFLVQLPYLRVLNLERNQLTGSVPLQLIERSKNGSLSLSVGENLNLCGSASCKKKNKVVVPIVASVGGLLIVSLIVVALLWGLKRRRTQPIAMEDTESSMPNMSFEAIQRQFTYAELLKMTNNFERILGKGGFGTVFHGYVDGTQVAVKMLSPSSVQGYQQFQSEARTSMGLIYEYMANGDLDAHLSDENSNIALPWKDRMRIAADAAQGLEYLHHGCKPPIIHRDVKCTNILLNENFQAKLADFGLSKIFPTDSGTHVSTVVAGTPGFLDPEYCISNCLTEKSDVYSFGVVLLEIISNRPAIERSEERTHISQWASSMLAKGDIKNIVDPRLPGNFNINSVWKAVEIAMACVALTAARRPTMSQVVAELKECLEIELAQTKEGHEGESADSIEMMSVNLNTELNPLARVLIVVGSTCL
ncbi:hypothetical protein CJ030_MR3G026346 [Morella rubra]|uniref:Protein kinase domain-containing protein n=1 Tax=Morella rubra TaxID=262757 RepID=A0A6A1W2A8_9ROSI|nr:hypothetical protein CJ030_MR3G026346 [Morella rubra]